MQARALLTPEQLKKLKESPAPGGKGMKMHHGPGIPETEAVARTARTSPCTARPTGGRRLSAPADVAA